MKFAAILMLGAALAGCNVQAKHHNDNDRNDDNVTISSEAELRRLAGPQSLIGLPTYTHNGVEYTREWGTESGQTELVALSEQLKNPDESYSIEHRSMLYARETGLTNRREFLLFSVEEDAEGTISLSTSLGISLYTTDFNTF